VGNTVITLLVAPFMIIRWGVAGAVASIPVLALLQLVLAIIILRRAPVMRALTGGLVDLLDVRAVQRAVVADLFKSGAVVLTGGSVQWLSLLVIRGRLLSDTGAESAGYYQSVIGVSTQYITLFLGWMAVYVFPRIAALDKSHVESEASLTLRANLLLLVPVLALVIGLADWLILLVYSPTFAPAADLLRFQALADIVRVVSWSLGALLFPLGRRRLHLGYHLVQNAVWVGCSLALLSSYGAGAAVFGYALSYLVSGVGAYVLLARAGLFRFSLDLLLRIGLSVGVLTTVYAAERAALPMLLVLPGALAIWLVPMLNRGERGLLLELPARLAAYRGPSA
jgi:PST family polysaccharide transporter